MTGSALILHGRPVSNYVNAVRMALAEKGLPHAFVNRSAVQDEAFLAMNPLGKIPVLETADGFLAETTAILDYLDDRYPENPLRPPDALGRGRMRQVINILQVYVEVPARGLYRGVFAAGEIAPVVADAAEATIARAVAALRALIAGPFLMGERLTQTDCFALPTFMLVDRLTQHLWDRSIVADLGLESWWERLSARESSRPILADFDVAFREYLVAHQAPFHLPELNAHA